MEVRHRVQSYWLSLGLKQSLRKSKLLCFWPDFFSLTYTEGEKTVFFFIYCNAPSNKQRKTVRQGGVAVELYVNKDGSLGRHRYAASLVHAAGTNTKCWYVRTPVTQQTQNHPPAGSWVLRGSLLLTLALWPLTTSVAITLNVSFFFQVGAVWSIYCAKNKAFQFLCLIFILCFSPRTEKIPFKCIKENWER